MTIATAMATSFKKELLTGTHNFSAVGGHAFKVALIKSGEVGAFGAASANYSELGTDEASGTGYTAGGLALTNVDPAIGGTTAFTTFSPNPSWTNATLSVNGCEIYNTTQGNKVVSTHDFGGTQSVTAGTLTLLMPTADAANAILRIG